MAAGAESLPGRGQFLPEWHRSLQIRFEQNVPVTSQGQLSAGLEIAPQETDTGLSASSDHIQNKNYCVWTEMQRSCRTSIPYCCPSSSLFSSLWTLPLPHWLPWYSWNTAIICCLRAFALAAASPWNTLKLLMWIILVACILPNSLKCLLQSCLFQEAFPDCLIYWMLCSLSSPRECQLLQAGALDGFILCCIPSTYIIPWYVLGHTCTCTGVTYLTLWHQGGKKMAGTQVGIKTGFHKSDPELESGESDASGSISGNNP